MPAPLKSWTEITARGPVQGKDEAIAVLVSAGSGAVIESDRRPGDLYESPRDQLLKACLPEGSAELTSLCDGLKALGWTTTFSTILDRDWSVAWRGGMRPLRLSCKGRGLLVRTSWSRALNKPDEAEVIIDPSMAFGTGTHPTTKMCLKALVRLLGGKGKALARGPILDVGTGSGILLIAALKLGVRGGMGLEIDSLAIRVARENLKINNVKARLSSSPLSKAGGKFSIITANLFSEELRRLGPELVKRLDSYPGEGRGCMVLSGILREQAPAVVSAYRGLGMRVFKRFVDGEWACLVLCRGGDEGGA